MNKQLVLTAWGSAWATAAVVAVLLGCAFALWAYRAHLRLVWAWGCIGLKALGFVLLAVCFLEPAWVSQRADPGRNLFVVLADNSKSLRLRDAGDASTRGERLTEVLRGEEAQTGQAPEWWQALNENFGVTRYQFGGGLERLDDWADGLTFAEEQSGVHDALNRLERRLAGEALAGVLLLTDGNATDEPVELFENLPNVSVYPLVLGQASPPSDLAIGQVSVTQTVFEDAPVTVQAQVQASGFAGQPVTLEWLDARGSVVASEVQTPAQAEQVLAFRLTHRPLEPGLGFYQLKVSGAGEQGADEATLINNVKPLVVQPQGGPYRVLYVAGRPNWEYKFLQRALAEDELVNLSALLRVAKREAKFAWRGRPGESTNPLFRGFDRSDDATEQFDEPVMIRLNVRDAEELREGFPKVAEDLYPYHAVILDDIEASFFTPAQMSLLKKFVTQRGGGLMMLGGQESFDLGGYDRTPVGDLLPVYVLDDGADESAVFGPFEMALTTQGLLEPWARLADRSEAESLARESMPGLRSVHPLTSLKPGAQVIASLTGQEARQTPAIVTQRSGRGRSLAVLFGDFWRWQLTDDDADAKLGKTWRQTVRWLVSDVPEPVVVSVEGTDGADGAVGEPVTLNVSVLDDGFEPRDDAVVRLQVQRQTIGEAQAATENTLIELIAEPSTEQVGVYTARFVPRASGSYRVSAVVSDRAGQPIQTKQTGFVALGAEREFEALSPNAAAMQRLAAATGGAVVEPAGLLEWAKSMPRQAAPNMITETVPLWHQPVLFVMALGCLVLEWMLRRRKGLA